MRPSEKASSTNVPFLSFAALGIVFGDIGTSPLYTFQTILSRTSHFPDSSIILGTLSLIIWTLFLITTLKYVLFALRFDNDGEGGIMALLSLLGMKKVQRPAIIAVGLFGAALIYGDGAITPAISVLSALEGMNEVSTSFKPYIVPASVLILVLLFSIQSKGTARIGKLFGPVMLIWFVIIAVLGIRGILQHPSVIAALNPYYAFSFLLSNGLSGFFLLGGVFLCVTGAEALYADMGHFGRTPIKYAWFSIVFPSLLLNYAGQAGTVLDGTSSESNIFYSLCPESLLIPMVILATIATIIASQAVITGAFSMTRQAILLGWLPRMWIKHTSSMGYGQIYIGVINYLLMFLTIGLTIGFGKSTNLASAYGIAVSMTMLMTTTLLFIAMRYIWKWNIFIAGGIASIFFMIDSAFTIANLAKIKEGGYIPLMIAVFVYLIMWIWHRGARAVTAQLHQKLIPLNDFLSSLEDKHIPRVPGMAVFLTRSKKDTPPVMVWHLRQNRSLHKEIFILHTEILQIPWVQSSDRISVNEISKKCWRAEVRYGFMERPDIPAILKDCEVLGYKINTDDVTYYIGRNSIMNRTDGKGLPPWQEEVYDILERNQAHLRDYFCLPSDQVVEIGRQVPI
ncbi:MAG: KUP/HAK/KT family potassium transporter [Gammaproteobacteria bacterium]|nr:KUP/HAK/KT family potassium transporter [Gammaproteobacteria bacterium]